MEEVDSRILHISKWVMAQGDGVAIADVNQDGLQDMFLSYSLKQKEDRAALYINQGDFKFSRFPLPALDSFIENYHTEGLAAAALFFDYDNDNDQDLLIGVGFGSSRLLKNELSETGKLGFTDVTKQVGLERHTTSMSLNVADFNRDGILDIVIGNALQTHMPDYDPKPEFSIFSLPADEYSGDMRPTNFMHRTWHNAANGGYNSIYIGNKDSFALLDNETSGFVGTRWTLDVGIGDLNNDGFADIYLANDFGLDQCLLIIKI